MDTDTLFGGSATTSSIGDYLLNENSRTRGSGISLPRRISASGRTSVSGLGPDILSASTYPTASFDLIQPGQHGKRRASQQFYGGVTFTQSAASSASGSPERSSDEMPPPQKKSKRAPKDTGEDNSKKQRGRPRLDTHDETAADRRRTQIRLAQRAYRNRKESTISGLKNRVEGLEKTIEQMSKSFLEFHDNAVNSGLLMAQPSLAQQLRNTTEKLLSLAKASSEDPDHEEESNENAQKGQSKSADSSPNQTTSAVFSYANTMQPLDLSLDSAPLGYELSFEGTGDDGADVEEVPRSSSIVADPTNQYGIISQFPKELWPENEYQRFNADMFDPSIDFQALVPQVPRPLKPSTPYTYSFQETTFARRLHRLSLERAFRALNNPNEDQAYVARAFRFTFAFADKKRVLSRFRELLKRKAVESLENWNVPFFRIGGAGTHFPRRDSDGRPIYPPNFHPPAKAFGPLPLNFSGVPQEEQALAQLLESIGFGGEWFDSHDVEEYLKTKGLVLDGHSSFIEVDPQAILSQPPPPLESSSAASSHSSGSPNRSPPTPHFDNMPYGEGGFIAQELPDPFAPEEFTLFHDKVTEFDTDRLDESIAFSAEKSPGHTPTFQEMLYRTRRPVTVDVERMLDRMVSGAACLGRAPGYRRKDVDNALIMAFQEAF